jgi:hypothetical protein
MLLNALGSRPTRIAIASALPIALLAVVMLWRLWPAVETTPFHRDEARWIGNSALLREWRDPFSDRWQDEGYRSVYESVDESNRRRSQAPLAMYLFGLGLIVQGEGLPNLGYWIMTEDSAWNAEQGNMPSPSEFRAARRTNVAVALLTLVAIYVLAAATINRVAGIAAGLIYALHPLVVSTSTRAFSDPLLVLCVVSAALAALWYGKRPSIARAALVGLLLGLGASAKLSPLLLAAAIACLVPLALLWTALRRNRRGIQWALAGATVAVTAAATFLASYPYLWTNPVTHTRRMIDFREKSFDWQADASPHARVNGLGDAMGHFGVQLGERESVGGVVLEWLDEIGLAGSWSWLREADLTLAALGWVLIFAFLVRERFSPRLIAPIGLLAGQALLIALTFRLDYARYMLPLLPVIALGVGATVGLGWQYVCAGAGGRWRPGFRPEPQQLETPLATNPADS